VRVEPGPAFPRVKARNLQGLDVLLPDAFKGERNVVLIAFRRNHQDLVDTWLPWLTEHAAADPGLRFYEVPTIGRMWAPVRNLIDGGMAAGIRVPEVLRRTLTVYGDIGQLTRPLGIDDTSTITVLGVDGAGTVCWSGRGGYDPTAARDLEDHLYDR